jgi:hypothetical protein
VPSVDARSAGRRVGAELIREGCSGEEDLATRDALGGDRIPRGPDKPTLLVVGVTAADDPDYNALLVVDSA